MKLDIIRAWKDENYRQSLSAEQLSTLPANPVCELELSDTDLTSISGGWNPYGALINDVSMFSVNILTNVFYQTCGKIR